MNNLSRMKLFSLLSESSQVTTEQMQQAYPKNPKQVKSQIYFIPKPKECLGIDSMDEFAALFEFSRQFVNEKGQPVPFISIKFWKGILTLPLGMLTNLKKEYSNEKPYKLTRVFDYLKNIIIKANRKQNEKNKFSDY